MRRVASAGIHRMMRLNLGPSTNIGRSLPIVGHGKQTVGLDRQVKALLNWARHERQNEQKAKREIAKAAKRANPPVEQVLVNVLQEVRSA